MTNAQLYSIRIKAAILSLVFGVIGFVWDVRAFFVIGLVFSIVWLVALFVLANRVVTDATKEKR